uniref:NADH-ubiquinone oxidoreductase chain 3 n=1 Tax=Paratomella rubra TaxID=90914 RepID=A0A1X9WD87_PARRR|nr:NADH dehydrogenase subunit 3 [Paratomella rubra]ARS00886.1 NADH dehydrogenase subunit 3 [Paratomella rubra]
MILLLLFILSLLLLIIILVFVFNYLPLFMVWVDKNSPYECGFSPFLKIRVPLSLQFFFIGLLFLLFDLEICFLIPSYSFFFFYFSNMFFLMFFILFFFFLLFCIYYEWFLGGLEWYGSY